jgi:hypothetical protein
LACLNVLLVQKLSQPGSQAIRGRARLTILDIQYLGEIIKLATGSGGKERENRQAMGRESYEPVFAL